MLKYRDPKLGRVERLDVRRGNVTTVLVPEITLNALAHYLTEAKTPKQKRVVDIVEEMLELERAQPVFTKKDLERGMRGAKWNQQRQVDRRKAMLNKRLAGYSFHPWLWGPTEKRWLVTWETERLGGRRALLGEHGELRLREGQALETIVNLARSGYLDRLRRCVHCHKWLYAKFRHQNFCSMKCQQKHYTQSEEWKAHRREYMRRYYQQVFSK